MQTPSLNLVVIRSADLDRSAGFYSALGLSFIKHRHGNGPEHLACEMGSAVFEIYPCAAQGDATAATRIGFKVPSVDAAVVRLAEMGVKLVSPAKDSPWGRRAVVDDPDGHRVELTESAAK